MMNGILSVAILLCAVAVMRRTGPVQRYMMRGIRETFAPSSGEGLSSFGVLCTTLAATLGTGNIVGVAGAVMLGGAGALFWMVAASFLCMALKYAECSLAVCFADGPFGYIREACGQRIAVFYATCGAAAGALGIGTLTQSDAVVRTVGRALSTRFPPFSSLGAEICTSVVLAAMTAAVLWGGAKRIFAVCETMVPLMAVGYLVCCVLILIRFHDRIPAALMTIWREAWSLRAGAGAWLGMLITGVSRGVFSNEAGLGTGGITAAVAKNRNAVVQGLLGESSVFIDTTLLCTLSGLCIVVTGAAGTDGAAATADAFQKGLGNSAAGTLGVFLCFFSFSTIIGWYFPSRSCFLYATGGCAEGWYRALYIFVILLTPWIRSDRIWQLAGVLNGMMALPNLWAVFRLCYQIPIVKLTK